MGRRTAVIAMLVLAACGGARDAARNAAVASSDRDVDIVDVDARVAGDPCPGEAEDVDGFEDDDGCSDLDDDRDRIADADDRCPREPETYNGLDDEDGCPDHCALPLTSGPIAPQRERFFFVKDSARLGDGALDLARAVAGTLSGNPQIKRVELHGHAGREERRPVALARRRAERLRDVLVSLGIDPARVVVIAHGASEPVTAGDTPEQRALNRRVELVLPDS
ncbi:OmpA family protein [Sandaracinus amylolyticus]|uniref:OmpA family protein n=1 Tax=Sandaracinus amylolyticus TaxID=927083 RepID=UPI0012EE1F36|nr:OmpA family protein [Sandaracinus amylolyticus]